MKLITACIIIVLLSTTAYSQSKKELIAEINSLKAQLEELQKPPVIDTSDVHKKASYGLGVLVATNLKMQGGDSLDVETLNAGLKDAFQGKPLMEQEESSIIVQQYMQKAMEAKSAKLREQNVTFLEENKKQEGITVTPSGLQYKVLKAGTGKTPGPADSVTVHYTGKLVDGTVFDSSESREPATFVVNQIIKGWTEALQLMREGDKWMIFIPSDLAYGEQGAGGQIPPNSTLIFEVELIKVTVN